MKTPVPRLRARMTLGCLVGLCALLVWSLLVPSKTLAEVSVALQPVSGKVTSVGILKAITDDPDPVPLIWRPYHAPSPAIALLNPQGEANGDGRASVLIHPQTEQALVAWAKHNPQGFDIVISRFVAGSWLEPLPIAQTPEQEVDPVLLVDRASGTLHVIYWIDSVAPRVMYSSAPADGSIWSTPVPVSAPGESSRRPDAAFHGGSLNVVYETVGAGYPSTPRQIVLATLGGGGFTSTVVGMTLFEQDNWPRVHSKRGRLWVDWIDTDGELAWSVSSGPSWEPVEIEPFTSPFDLEFHARGRVAAQVLATAP